MSTNPNETHRVTRSKAEVRASRWYLVAAFVFMVPALLFPVLWLLVLGLVIAGSIVSQRWRCSNCANRVDRHARMCPTCQSRFQ